MSLRGLRTVKEQCLSRGILWEDPDFPAENRSIYYSKVDRNIAWKRPFELVNNPQFVVSGASRFDLNQGSIGNCWYIAGVATVATRPELFSQIAPADQSFDRAQYAGVFAFHFWQFGRWVEVLVDDRLPTYSGKNLIFCHNRDEPNEFWAPLIEKAYAKLHGSYEALDGGWTEDALVDFTGGVGRRIDLTNKKEIERTASHLFKSMTRDAIWNSLQGCSINSTSATLENELENGLVIGHAYSITSVATVKDNKMKEVHLLRLRNPWGRIEWKNEWSDRSRSWQRVDEKIRNQLRHDDQDGEFWMSFEDWLQNFDQLQVCYLPPSNVVRDKKVWRETVFHGEWVKGVSAGGCGNPPDQDLYWTNPQFSVTLKDPDEDDNDKKCTLIVSLMQKDSRRMRSVMRVENANVAMTFDIYKVDSSRSGLLDPRETRNGGALRLARGGVKYEYYREVTHEERLDPGTYIIIPSTFDPNHNRKFVLRYYAEHEAVSTEIDLPTEPILKPKSNQDILQEMFLRHSGSDRVVDSRELTLILNEAFRKELGHEHNFESEACRSLLAMFDTDRSGVLEWPEVQKMWAELTTWLQVFLQFDKDSSGYIDVAELRNIFNNIGYSLSRRVLASIVRRYGGKENRLTFNDFVMALTKVAVHIQIFTSHSKEGGLKGNAKFSLDEYMEVAMFF